MTVLETLVNARQLIAAPSRWTRGSRAIAADGMIVSPWSAAAVRFCAVGALERAAGRRINASDDADPIVAAVGRHIVFVNDALGHDAVLTRFDIAIDRLRRRRADPWLIEPTATVEPTGEPVGELVAV